jgi:RND superfamily putative drug exporter
LTGFARWCFRHRKTVLCVWLIALVAFLAAGRSAGSSYTKSFSLPGTGSNQAQAVLQADFPAQVGDSDQIVMRARRGTLRTPAVEAAVTGMLARVSRLPDVRSVASPYRTVGQISANGTIGFATVTLDAAAQDVPKASVTGLISAAQSADSPVLEVELGGQAIEDNQPASGSASLLLGVVLALIVLFFAFRRSVLGAVLPLISALAAIGIASPAVEALSHAMPVASFAPEVAILVALGVGVDYFLFVVSRHRSGLLAGMDPQESAVTALNTSGRAVLLAGTTVCVAILGLFALQVSFLYGVAVSVALAVALTMLASLTLLPAMLGFLGPRVLRRAERAPAGTRRPDGAGGWHRWARMVSRRAAVSSVFAFAVIVVLALPFFSRPRPLLSSTGSGRRRPGRKPAQACGSTSAATPLSTRTSPRFSPPRWASSSPWSSAWRSCCWPWCSAAC